MKIKSFFCLFIIAIILIKNPLFNLLTNIKSSLFIKTNNLELSILKKENEQLKDDYQKLLDFKNQIKINQHYQITNISRNNYGFDKLIINGQYALNSEVVCENGLIGIITKTSDKYSEAAYLKNTNIPVVVNNSIGKINGSKNDNLIITNISNYSNINLNDKVYSINNNYIGLVITINNNDIEQNIIVKPIPISNINYVGVIAYDY